MMLKREVKHIVHESLKKSVDYLFSLVSLFFLFLDYFGQ